MSGVGLTARRAGLTIGACGLLAVLALLLCPLIGPRRVDLALAFAGPGTPDHDIVFGARLPRTLFAVLAGGLLAAAGVSFQAVLRNPLASPFTLGVSGGAALGAVVAIRFGWDWSFGPFHAVPAAALAGALGVVGVVAALAASRRRFTPVTLLLAGVIVNFICSSLILLVHYLADLAQSFAMAHWTMGALDLMGYQALGPALATALLGFALLLPTLGQLDVMSVGEDWARSRGTDVGRVAARQYLGASLLTAAVVAYAGPIGFVGLIVPHTLRLVVGADHRLLFPASLFAGGAFLVACDTVARTVIAPVELPVGVVTALLGGPFFLWLLLARGRELFF